MKQTIWVIVVSVGLTLFAFLGIEKSTDKSIVSFLGGTNEEKRAEQEQLQYAQKSKNDEAKVSFLKQLLSEKEDKVQALQRQVASLTLAIQQQKSSYEESRLSYKERKDKTKKEPSQKEKEKKAVHQLSSLLAKLLMNQTQALGKVPQSDQMKETTDILALVGQLSKDYHLDFAEMDYLIYRTPDFWKILFEGFQAPLTGSQTQQLEALLTSLGKDSFPASTTFEEKRLEKVHLLEDILARFSTQLSWEQRQKLLNYIPTLRDSVLLLGGEVTLPYSDEDSQQAVQKVLPSISQEWQSSFQLSQDQTKEATPLMQKYLEGAVSLCKQYASQQKRVVDPVEQARVGLELAGKLLQLRAESIKNIPTYVHLDQNQQDGVRMGIGMDYRLLCSQGGK